MAKSSLKTIPLIALLCGAIPSALALAEESASSITVIGPNQMLADGAEALRRGDYQEGVALTLEGLNRPTAPIDAAAGLANLCAGYVGLGQYELALAKCNQSLELNPTNWRTWNNRAAAYIGKGMLEAALNDVQAGLKLFPDSGTLKKTRHLVLERKRLREEERRKAVRA